jgi:hypothetical protein
MPLIAIEFKLASYACTEQQHMFVAIVAKWLQTRAFETGIGAVSRSRLLERPVDVLMDGIFVSSSSTTVMGIVIRLRGHWDVLRL